MPNWCEGILKVRGTKENIVNFLQNALKCVDVWGNEEEKHEVKLNEFDDIEFRVKKEIKHPDFHIEGTHRNFIEIPNETFILYESDKADIYCICLYNYRAAWGITAEPLRELSEKYGVDLKIYGFERGMAFNQDIEIVGGKIIKDKEIKFEDYIWECTNPELGG